MVVDRSIIRPAFYKLVVNPLYDRFCKNSRIHPNTITLIGLLIVVCVFLLIKSEPNNRILNFAASVGIFFYAVADPDHFDGMHARKTDRCSDLGEFLDHFCDYLSGFALILMVYLINNFSFGILLFFSVLYSVGFVAAHVEHVRASRLYFGRFGPLEAVIGVSIYLLAGAIVPSVWLNHGSTPTILSYAFIIVYALGFAINIFGCLSRNSIMTIIVNSHFIAIITFFAGLSVFHNSLDYVTVYTVFIITFLYLLKLLNGFSVLAFDEIIGISVFFLAFEFFAEVDPGASVLAILCPFILVAKLSWDVSKKHLKLN